MIRVKQEKGFTLVETLITLLITSLLILLPSLSISKMTRSIEIDLFFRELSSHITMMQNHAILSNETTKVEFSPKMNIIRFKVNNGYGLVHPLDGEISLDGRGCKFYGEEFQAVEFKKNTGNISVLAGYWRIKFETNKGLYELVFKLGSGRFDIRKI